MSLPVFGIDVFGVPPQLARRAQLAELDRRLAAAHRRSAALRPPRTEAEQAEFEKASAEIDQEIATVEAKRAKLANGRE